MSPDAQAWITAGWWCVLWWTVLGSLWTVSRWIKWLRTWLAWNKAHPHPEQEDGDQ